MDGAFTHLPAAGARTSYQTANRCPNRSPPEEIARLVAELLAGDHRRRSRELGEELRSDPGPRRAVRFCGAVG